MSGARDRAIGWGAFGVGVAAANLVQHLSTARWGWAGVFAGLLLANVVLLRRALRLPPGPACDPPRRCYVGDRDGGRDG